jgi:hypothetical protein
MRYIIGALVAGLLAGCGPSDSPQTPDEAPAEASMEAEKALANSGGNSDSASLTTYIWEKVTSNGYTAYTTPCSMKAGSPCTTPGETCTYLSARYPDGSSSTTGYVCRQAVGTYGPTQYRNGTCPSSYTVCPSSNPQGQPCSETFTACIWYCYNGYGPMQYAVCN